MMLGFIMLAFIYILYVLFVKGALFKIILGIFGWYGMYLFLNTIPDCRKFPFNNDTFTYSMTIPTIIVFLCLLTTKED